MRVPRMWQLLIPLALVAAACGGDDDGGEVSDTVADTTIADATDDAGDAGDSAPEDFQIGMILVGPQNDRGWSQAHFEAGEYVMEQARPARRQPDRARQDEHGRSSGDDDRGGRRRHDRPGRRPDLRHLGRHEGRHRSRPPPTIPDVPMIWSSGDNAWADGKGYRADLTNLGNVMGRMEYGKMIAGCAAALTTETGTHLLPRSADQRRDPSAGQLGLPRCAATAGERTRAATRPISASRSSGSASGSTFRASPSTRPR